MIWLIWLRPTLFFQRSMEVGQSPKAHLEGRLEGDADHVDRHVAMGHRESSTDDVANLKRQIQPDQHTHPTMRGAFTAGLTRRSRDAHETILKRDTVSP